MLKLYLYFEIISKCVQMFESLQTKYVDFLIYELKATKSFHNFLNLFESQNLQKQVLF
jgi:hypothetical protein